jgi:hypothetical protein
MNYLRLIYSLFHTLIVLSISFVINFVPIKSKENFNIQYVQLKELSFSNLLIW